LSIVTIYFNILIQFVFIEKNIEDYFCDVLENSRNMIENKFLMVKMNLSGSLEKNLYNYVSLIAME